MFRVPAAAEPLAKAFEGAFTRPTFGRFLVLMAGLIVTMGRRTVSRVLRVMEPLLGEGALVQLSPDLFPGALFHVGVGSGIDATGGCDAARRQAHHSDRR
jgi:hypothetical protein